MTNGLFPACPSCGGLGFGRFSSLTVTAKEVGYYVVSRNGVPISGPYATRSDAAPNMIEQRGAAIMFIGPGDSEEWAALKAKQFPALYNTVNGSKQDRDWDLDEDPWAGQHTAEWATYDTVGGDPVGPKCEACGGTPTRKNDGVNLCSDCDRRYSEHPLTAASDAAALVCMECNKKFKRKVGPGSTPKCPGCGGYDVEPDYQGGFPLHGSMQERYIDGRRVASLRHFADDDEVGPEEDEWFKQPKGLTDQVDTGVAPTPEIQDPNPIAGQDLERIPRNLAEAARMYAEYGDEYNEEPECDYCGGRGHTFRSCPARDDDYHDQLDDPWNQQPSAGDY